MGERNKSDAHTNLLNIQSSRDALVKAVEASEIAAKDASSSVADATQRVADAEEKERIGSAESVRVKYDMSMLSEAVTAFLEGSPGCGSMVASVQSLLNLDMSLLQALP